MTKLERYEQAYKEATRNAKNNDFIVNFSVYCFMIWSKETNANPFSKDLFIKIRAEAEELQKILVQGLKQIEEAMNEDFNQDKNEILKGA